MQKPREVRLTRRVPVQFSDEPGRWYIGETMDLSRSGLALRSSHLVPPLGRLEIRFPMWPREQPSLFGLVRWAKSGQPGAMGVRFQTANDSYLKLISNLGTKRIAPGIFIPDMGASKTPVELSKEGWKPRITRHACSMSVRCGAAGGRPVEGVLFNISAEGAGLNAPKRFEPGTELWMTIAVPEEPVARVEGVVVWAHPCSDVRRGWSAHGIHVDCANSGFYDLFIHRLQLAAHRWESAEKAAPQETEATEEAMELEEVTIRMSKEEEQEAVQESCESLEPRAVRF